MWSRDFLFTYHSYMCIIHIMCVSFICVWVVHSVRVIQVCVYVCVWLWVILWVTCIYCWLYVCVLLSVWCPFIAGGFVVGCGISGASAHSVEKDVEVADEMVLSSLLLLNTVDSTSFPMLVLLFL